MQCSLVIRRSLCSWCICSWYPCSCCTALVTLLASATTTMPCSLPCCMLLQVVLM